MARREDPPAGRSKLGVLAGESATPGGRDTVVVTLLGATIPVPRWTLGWMGVLVLAGLTVVIGRHLGIDVQDMPWQSGTLKELELAEQEYSRHMWEEAAQTWAAPDGVFTIKTFEDHCVAIQRKVGSEYRTKLVPDLALKPGRDATFRAAPQRSLALLGAAVNAVMPSLDAQGKCRAPHPGKFETSTGPRHGCRVQVWRRWADGCAHYQMRNACNGAWDTNADGSPRVTWTACRH